MKKVFFVFLFLFLVSILSSQTNNFAPDFRLKEYSTGKSVSLEKLLDGKTIVILSFFDTKCEPCKKELPHLENISKKFVDSVKVFLISLDDKPENVLPEYIKKYNVTIPVLIDPMGYLAGEKYGVTKYGRAEVPQIFVIGKDGKIKKHFKGYQPNLEEILAKTIEQLKSEKDSIPQKNIVTIVYTNSANGHLESCDCPENPFGGLVRRVYAINELKQKKPSAIVVDSGDFFPPRADELLAEYCIKMMEKIKYDIIAVGDQELLCGVDYLKKNLSRLPFYSANLQTCNDEMCFPLLEKPYLIKKVNEINVALVSIINPDVFLLFPKDKTKNIKVLNHIEYLKGIIPELRKKADIVVLVSHSGDEEDRIIAKEIPGIDVIVGGHSQTFHREPVKIENTLIVQTGENGHRVGILELELNSEKKIISYSNNFVLLNKEIPDDPSARQLIKDYNAQLKEKTKQLLK